MLYNTLNDNKCFFADFTFFSIILLAGAIAVLIITIIKMLFALTEKNDMVNTIDTDYSQNNTTILYTNVEIADEAIGLICGLTGEYEGMEIELNPNSPIIIGRDPKESQLIVKSEKISRKHCSVTFDKVLKKFIVIDYSFNGTYTKSGERLHKDHQNILPPNSIIVIDNNSFQFKLK